MTRPASRSTVACLLAEDAETPMARAISPVVAPLALIGQDRRAGLADQGGECLLLSAPRRVETGSGRFLEDRIAQDRLQLRIGEADRGTPAEVRRYETQPTAVQMQVPFLGGICDGQDGVLPAHRGSGIGRQPLHPPRQQRPQTGGALRLDAGLYVLPVRCEDRAVTGAQDPHQLLAPCAPGISEVQRGMSDDRDN
ncbi:hypothetical protein JOF59_001365 [Streptomyces clavifer]|uniref:Uncharacterized protein n=1 Tax=Streptomyces clavifer TaxID=68188 RepID=A0ABS4V4X4_9ACTN|nr:hypothetical protein [Streptomyces clavifer]